MNHYLSWNYYVVPDYKSFIIKKTKTKKKTEERNLSDLLSAFRLIEINFALLAIFLSKFISCMLNYIVLLYRQKEILMEKG